MLLAAVTLGSDQQQTLNFSQKIVTRSLSQLLILCLKNRKRDKKAEAEERCLYECYPRIKKTKYEEVKIDWVNKEEEEENLRSG